MRLVFSGQSIQLPNDLLWVDELDWTPTVSAETYSLTGALLYEVASKQAGRPITLEQPQDDGLAWVTRATVESLRTWASVPGREMTLVLEYPSDTRSFPVVFRHHDTAIEAKPVKGFPEHSQDDWFSVTLRLLEV